MPETIQQLEARIAKFHEGLKRLEGEIGRVIVGNRDVIRQVIVALFSGGHVLLEGVPGIGKTMLVRTIAECLSLKFSRIQFTPDLMPADITGTNLITEDEHGRRRFQFQHGPVFAHILLADEINRATPKTQSALLEAMAEKSVTAAGTRYVLEEPYFVLATQNPIEMEGTYPLPEAQLDRFMFKVRVPVPDPNELLEVIERTTGSKVAAAGAVMAREVVLESRALAREVPLARPVAEFVARLVAATHPERPECAPMAKKYLRYGASPRAAQALVLGGKVRALIEGRPNVAFADVRAMALPSMRHRLILNFQAEAEGVSADAIVAKVMEEVPELPE